MRVLLLVLLMACNPPAHPRVKDGFIRDAAGGVIIARGVNVAQAHKSTPFFDATTDYAFIRHTLGMNTVRFLLQWQAIEPSRGAYDQAYLSELSKQVTRATGAGLYVVLDMHQDLYGSGFAGGNGAPAWACDELRYTHFTPRVPWLLGYVDENVVACFDGFWREHQEAYASAWQQVARTLGQDPRILGFDIMNEPSWGSADATSFEAQTLTPFYDHVIAAVRQAQPEWIAFVEPAASRNLGIPSSLRRLKAQNVVYAPHLYDAGAETNQGFSGSRRDGLILTASELANEANALGMALWIGEYGGQPAHAGFAEYMDTVYGAISAHTAGSAYWHLGRDAAYGIFDREGVAKEALLDAIVRPYPERIGGEPLEISFDPASRRFTLTQTPGSGETIISVPPRVYPTGLVCNGCIVKEGRATFSSPAAKIEIEPRD